MILIRGTEGYMELARRTGMPAIVAHALGRAHDAGHLGGHAALGLEGARDARTAVRYANAASPPLLRRDGRLAEGDPLDPLGLWLLMLFEDGAGGQAAMLSRAEWEPFVLAWPAAAVLGGELGRLQAAILGNGRGGSALVVPEGPGPGCVATTLFLPRPVAARELAELARAAAAAAAAPPAARH